MGTSTKNGRYPGRKVDLMQQYDLQEMAKQIRKTLCYHDSKDLFNFTINEDHIVSMLRRWQRNKAKIVDNLFDGELQIKIPIDQARFRFGEATNQIHDFLEKRIADDRKKDKQRFYRQFLMIEGEELEHIFENKRVNPQKPSESWFLHPFVDWKLSNSNLSLYEGRAKLYEASDNCKSPKLTKQIKAIMQAFEYSSKEIEDALSVFSEIQSFDFQLEKADYLTLSVHPLDFITLSINDYGWSSCVNLNKEHFPSTFSSMQDAATMICYLEGQKSKLVLYREDGENVYWNNKKIRALMCADHKLENIFINETYPNKQINDFNKIVADFFNAKGYKLTEMVSRGWHSDDDTDSFKYSVDKNPHFYLDSPSGKCLLTKLKEPRLVIFDVGLDALCLHCGESLGEHGTQVGGLCEECADYFLKSFDEAYEYYEEDIYEDECSQNWEDCEYRGCDVCPYRRDLEGELFVPA